MKRTVWIRHHQQQIFHYLWLLNIVPHVDRWNYSFASNVAQQVQQKSSQPVTQPVSQSGSHPASQPDNQTASESDSHRVVPPCTVRVWICGSCLGQGWKANRF